MSGSLEFVDSASQVSQLSLGMPGSASRVLEGRELLYLLSFPKLWSSALAARTASAELSPRPLALQCYGMTHATSSPPFQLY